MVEKSFSNEQNESIRRNGAPCSKMKPVYANTVDTGSREEIKASHKDTKCGFGCFYPNWLQFLASKKTFVFVYALAGMQQMVVGSYYVGIMSTLEKTFNMSSLQSGIISASWDVGSLFTNIIITYIAAKGHRTRWVAFGTLLVGISCLMRVWPHYIFGPPEVTKMYTKEFQSAYSNRSDFENASGSNSTGLTKLSTNINCGSKNDLSNIFSFYSTLTAHVILGVGTAVYWTCGATYLDDNVRKNIVPALLAIVQVIRLLGPTVGFLLSSYALNIYVDPRLTPSISPDDPRWIGAWWLGWYPIGISSLLMAVFLFLFPKSLPRAAVRKGSVQTAPNDSGLSISDFRASMTRILKNKIIVYNSLSSVCFTMGLMAYWTFMPKYMESQFRLSPSKSSFLTGTVGLLCNGLGVMASGLIISKLKPSPRFLAGWNVFVEILDVIGYASYSFMSCHQQEYHGHWNDNHRSWNLTETCNANLGCGTHIQFAPVCDVAHDLAFYSPCHAGCNASYVTNGITEYTGCSCVPGGKVIDGLCPTDCSSNIVLFVLVMGGLSFTSATGRAANTLIQFRCVEERDKSLSIGVSEALLSLLAFIPSPIFYGKMMDWTCIVWGDNCGSNGNCWLYDGQRLRLVFNLSAAFFLLIGTILDCFVCYYAKGLKIYDEDFTETKTEKHKAPIVKKSVIPAKNEIELPLIRSSQDTSIS